MRFGSMPESGFQECDTGQRIGGEVLGGTAFAGGAADAAIVDAQDSDAAAGEGIGQDQERLVSRQRFVAILRAGTGDQEHGWVRGGRGAVLSGYRRT